jgi:hypothetical protein
MIAAISPNELSGHPSASIFYGSLGDGDGDGFLSVE